MFEGTLIFAGGGTGGHLYPGLAIAERVSELSDGKAQVLFVCSDRPLDSEILTKQGVDFIPIGARPLSLRPRGLARFMASWGKAVRESRRLIRELRADENGSPNRGVRVVAMGGFVAAPVVQAARVERVPVTLVNLDAVPGKANRWIAHRAATVLTAARVAAPFAADWAMTGPVVRRAALAQAPKQESRIRLGLDPHRSTLMVTGGSQGAASINAFVSRAVLLLKDEMSRSWQVLHQCGKGSAGSLSEAYAQAGVPAVVQEFTDAIGDWWGAADVAIGRAGAGTVAEAWANRVPTVFMPYPYHRDQHQRANAMAVVDAGGGRLLEDRIDPDANLAANIDGFRELIRDAPVRDRMTNCLEKLGPADGADRAARVMID
jgi:UDP-N-acetylglucosamine--N-acetylmuramyl-(pentapeptide) pyrophosphoryl-undecaprenol N-acetylglucosamine transferase